jgi:protein-S-isoprenylcysteine O-methyltransferase Ste14
LEIPSLPFDSIDRISLQRKAVIMNQMPNLNPAQETKASSPDKPGVIVFPPVLFLSALGLGIALQLKWPIPFGQTLLPRIIGGILLVTSPFIAIPAFLTMRRAGTNVDPGKPSTVVVGDGPYRFTRNPIYLANTLLYMGLSLVFNAVWPLLTLVPSLLLLHWGVVLREERYLEGKFGEGYLAYKRRVRRWF